MSDGFASSMPDTVSDKDAMLQRAMTLIEDDENGTILKILRHAGVVHPLDLLLFSEDEFSTKQINDASSDWPTEVC